MPEIARHYFRRTGGVRDHFDFQHQLQILPLPPGWGFLKLFVHQVRVRHQVARGVRAAAAGNAFVGELAALSRELSQLGAIGLESLEYLENGRTVPESWTAQKKQMLAAMSRPSAEVVLAAVRPVRLLVEAASKRNQGAFRR